MPDSLPLTPSTDPDPLCISGMLAIHAARVAIHMPGWPSLHRFVEGKAPQPVSLAEAEADLLRGWGVSGYVYPVPRAFVPEERMEPVRAAALRGHEVAALMCLVSAAGKQALRLAEAGALNLRDGLDLAAALDTAAMAIDKQFDPVASAEVFGACGGES